MTAVVAIGLTFLLMGLVVSAYGPLLEHLTRRFGVSLPVAGATISVHFAGGLVGVLIAMRSMERLPARVTVMAGSGIASLGCAAVAVAFIWPFFLAAIFVIGLGFGALVLALNQLVAYSEGRRRAALLSALNSAYSAGAVAGPVLVVVFARDHFSLFFLAAAAVALALILGAAGTRLRLHRRLHALCRCRDRHGRLDAVPPRVRRPALTGRRNSNVGFLSCHRHGAPADDADARASA
ncbi:MAG: MFS transporter [Chloroflexi bacterium]|nr:MAG: MFS transporter [Chloroflexota bacterium]